MILLQSLHLSFPSYTPSHTLSRDHTHSPSITISLTSFLTPSHTLSHNPSHLLSNLQVASIVVQSLHLSCPSYTPFLTPSRTHYQTYRSLASLFNHFICRVFFKPSKLLAHYTILGYSVTPVWPMPSQFMTD